MVRRGFFINYNLQNKHKHTFLNGACKQWLAEPKSVPIYFEHREHLKAGNTVEYVDDLSGLQCGFILNDTPLGRDMKRLIEAGIIESLSAAYIYDKNLNPVDDISLERDIKVLHDIEEISLVMYPGFPQTMLEGTKVSRETFVIDYKERLEKIFLINYKLETTEVLEIIMERWRQVYSAFLDGQKLIHND